MIFMIPADTPPAAGQRITAAEIFAKYRNAMYRIAFRIVNHPSDAEDAVMKAAENICANIESFSELEENEIKLLVSSIVKNAAIDIYRKNKRNTHRNIDDYCFEDPDALAVPDESITAFLDNYDFGSLQKHVTGLKEKYKIVLLLKYRENLSNGEIGKRLGIPVSTVATHIARAKQILKKKVLEEKNNDPE